MSRAIPNLASLGLGFSPFSAHRLGHHALDNPHNVDLVTIFSAGLVLLDHPVSSDLCRRGSERRVLHPSRLRY